MFNGQHLLTMRGSEFNELAHMVIIHRIKYQLSFFSVLDKIHFF